MIQSESGLSEQQKAAMITEVNGVKPMTASMIKEIKDPATRSIVALSYAQICGNGSVANAYTSVPTDGKADAINAQGKVDEFVKHLDPMIMICPGLLVHLVDSGDPIQALGMILGHELGHNIDANHVDPPMGFLKEDGKVVSRDFSKHYQNFLKCIRKNHLGELSDFESIAKTLEKEKADEQQIKLYQFYAQEKSNDDAVTAHQGEIIADYWGFKIMTKRLNQIPKDKIEQSLIMNLQFFCSQERDDGFHPKGNFRINMALQNPDLPKNMGV